MKEVIGAILGVIVALGALCIPFVIWGLIMMLVTWLVVTIYALGPQQIFSWPDIAYWPAFFTLWFLSIVGNLVFRRS